MTDTAYQIVGGIFDEATENVLKHLVEEFGLIGELLNDINTSTFHLITEARFYAGEELGRKLGYNEEEANNFVKQIDNRVVFSTALETAIGIMLERLRQALLNCGFSCGSSREFWEAVTGDKIKGML